jgi:hypothetical protein
VTEYVRPGPAPDRDEPAVFAILERVCRSLGCVSLRHEDLDCTVWSSALGLHLAVTIGDTTAVRRIGEGERLRDAILARIDTRARDDVTCLVVVPDTSNWRAIEHAVVLRRAAEHVRVATVGALTALAELVDTGTISDRQAVLVLRPASPFADAVVAVIAAIGLGLPRTQALLSPLRPPLVPHMREESATAPATAHRGSRPAEEFRP